MPNVLNAELRCRSLTHHCVNARPAISSRFRREMGPSSPSQKGCGNRSTLRLDLVALVDAKHRSLALRDLKSRTLVALQPLAFRRDAGADFAVERLPFEAVEIIAHWITSPRALFAYALFGTSFNAHSWIASAR